MGAFRTLLGRVLPQKKAPTQSTAGASAGGTLTPVPATLTGPGNMTPGAPTPPQSPTPQPTLQYGPVSGQQFSQANNLIGTQLNAGMSPDTAAARANVSQNLGSLQGPDRGALAQQTFQQLQSLSEPAFQQQLRQVGQKAASLGRIGAGMTTSELGDVASNRNKYLGTLQQQLATDAAGQTLGDRLNTFGASQSALGQLSGLDQQQYGNLFGERAYQAGLNQDAFNNNQQQLGMLSGLGFGGNNQALQQLIAQQYGNQAQGAFGASGDILRLLMSQPKKAA